MKIFGFEIKGSTETRAQMRRELEAEIQAEAEDRVAMLIQAGVPEGATDPASLLIYDWFLGENEEFLSTESKINALIRRYNGISTNGRELTKSIIEDRVTWIAGNGVNVQAEGEKENEFLEEFIRESKLDGTLFRELVTDSELTGRTLIFVEWDAKEQRVCVRYLSYADAPYTVVSDPDDYRIIKSVEFKDGKRDAILTPDKFVYGKFSGLRSRLNESPPRTGMVLQNIDAVSMALRDLRAINHKFGAAFPVFETETNQDAKDLRDTLKQTKWKIGNSLAGKFKAHFMEPSGAGLDSIIKEILMHFRIISNATAIPVFFLAPDLMSNRATASELMESINAGTAAERETWKDVITSVCRIAMKLYTAKTGIILNYDDIQVSIPQVTLNQVQQLVDVYLPLQMAGIISKKTIREMTPGIDPELEEDRIEEESGSQDGETSNVEVTDLMDIETTDTNTTTDMTDTED